VIADTNTYLLTGLKDGANERVWSEFCARHRPVLITFGRRLGLSAEDAQDAAQDALLAFADAYRRGQYARDKGRLRTWLYAIARNQIYQLQRSGERQAAVNPDDKTRLLEEVPEPGDSASIWEEVWRKGLIQSCLEEARRHFGEETLQAFTLFVLREQSADEVAASLGISRNAVFKAKRRVLSHMRDAYRMLDADW
jgi:RNA polymerase sigma-70 factor (ECF subfamily)